METLNLLEAQNIKQMYPCYLNFLVTLVKLSKMHLYTQKEFH